MNNKPMATIVVNTRCNQQCVYCPPMGEAFDGKAGSLDFNQGHRVISELFSHGIRVFRISGGEPLLHNDIEKYLELFSVYKKKGAIVHLNTNGVLLKKFSEFINSKTLSSVRISLDSLNANKYREITGTNTLDRVIEGINMAKNNNVQVDLIMVVMRHNFDEINGMIDFCIKNKIGLKLSDLEPHPYDDQGYFTSQYISLVEIHSRLKESCDYVKKCTAENEWGLDMVDYIHSGVRIRVKDTSLSSMYSDYCRQQCPEYQCPEGIYSIIIKPNGSTTWCKRNEKVEDLIDQSSGNSLSSCFDSMTNCKRENRSANNMKDNTSTNIIWSYKGNQRSFGRDKLMLLDNRPVELSNFSSEWILDYHKEKNIIVQCLKGFDVSIEHIGSTAIEGIIAKPIIDLAIGIKGFNSKHAEVMDLLSTLGYTLVLGVIKNLPKRRVLWKGSVVKHTHHVHITEKNGRDWKDLILFKKFISTNSEARSRYEKEKKLLASKFKNDISSYANGKELIYKELLLMAKNSSL